MFIEREVRERMNALSKEVTGVASKWKSMLDHGTNELVTEMKTETIPGENGQPDKTEEVKVPVLMNGTKQFRHKSYTFEEVETLFLNMKKGRDEYLAKLKAQREQRELEQKVQAEAKGVVKG